MKKCPQCDSECNDDTKFCEECGYTFPQTKECPQCHAELKMTAKFCSECGYSFIAPASEAGKGSFVGDKNVISGDVVGGNLDRRTYNGNVTTNNTNNTSNVITNNTSNNSTTTNVYNQDESKKIVQCEVCKRHIVIGESFECPACHRIACLNCRDKVTGLCKDCATKQVKKQEAAYCELLEEVLNDNIISLEERIKLEELRKKIGLSEQRAKELESDVRNHHSRLKTDSLTTFEHFSLDLAYTCLYHEGDAAKAEKLLLSLSASHKSIQNVIIYAPLFEAISYRDESLSQQKINAFLDKADIPQLYYLLFDIAIRNNVFVKAEQTLRKLEVLEHGSTLLACRQIVLLLAMSEEMKDKGMRGQIAAMVSDLPDSPAPTAGTDWEASIQAKMEASWICRVKYMFKEANGEDVQFLNKEFCESKNLFFALASGMLDKKVKQQKAALKAKEQQEKERQKRQREYEALLDKHREMGIQISEDGKTLYKFPEISTITDYEIPEGIVFIGVSAFLKCSQLRSVKIPSSVKVIKGSAFEQCLNLCNVYFSEGLERIESSAFEGCPIHRLDLPNTLLNIECFAFKGCPIYRLDLPDTLLDIGDNAFSVCTNLEEVHLPQSLKRLGRGAFGNCTELRKLFIPASIQTIVFHHSGTLGSPFVNVAMNQVKIITTEYCPKCNA
ncbi:MAG: leucine-rich repeat protein, partial [Lentisphaeria bacterium]|nr:leucine-rich repeat protein [Lentisphaeria bacterium]